MKSGSNHARILALVTALIVPLGAVEAFVFAPEENLAEIGDSYFVPAGRGVWRARLPEQKIRYFHVQAVSNGLRRVASPDGWSGWLSGDSIRMYPPKAERAKDAVQYYEFEHGKIVRLMQGGEASTFNYPEMMPISGEPPSLWRTREEFSKEELQNMMWQNSGRLRLGYKNPNCLGALMSMCAVMGLCLVLYASPIWRLHGVLLLAIFLILMSQSQSRGALLAFVLAAVVSGSKKAFETFRMASVKPKLTLAAVILAAGVVLFLGYRERLSKVAMNRHSDSGRTETLVSVPEMMACGPGGWNEPVAGMTYTMWFQELDRTQLVKDMINEHFTFLVMHSLPVRLGYIAFWICIIFVLFIYFMRGGSPIPLAVWLIQGVTAACNRTYESPTLWIIPVCALVFAAWRIPWRRDGRIYARGIALGLGVSVLVLALAQGVGSRLAAKHRPSIYSTGKVVYVNGRSPRHWVVDEPSVLAPEGVGKEIRAFYRSAPQAPAIGYVRQLDDLPRQVEHLTLFGRSCARFVEAYRNGSLVCKPARVTFISPTVPPEQIPEALVREFRLRVVAGEFLIRYWATDFDWRPPEWVLSVPDAEIYIPGWMRACVD